MIAYILIGSGFAFAAAIQPGPLQAFLFSSVVQKGWKKTLPAALAPLLSDGPIAVIVLLVINKLPDFMKPLLQCAGGVFLLFIAYKTYLNKKKNVVTDNELKSSAPKTVLQAAFVNLLNPNPYIGWSLVLGPAIINAWQIKIIYGTLLLISFYVTMIICLGLIIITFGLSGMLDSKKQNSLSVVSILILVLIGTYQLISGVIISIQ